MAFPAPKKKARISMESGSSEVDPFKDFEDEESFTADDLEQIDIIESQAMSQIPKEDSSLATTSTKPHVNGANVAPNFSFKPLTSRSPNVPRKSSANFQQKTFNRPPSISSHGQTKRQTNITVPVAGLSSSKIYTGYLPPSQDKMRSSPPFISSQNRFKKGVEAQPTCKNPRLQQSNVSLPLHKKESPQSQGFGVSHTLLPPDSDHQQPTCKPFQNAVPAKELRHSLSAQTIAQGGAQTKSLTPPKGCTSSGTPSLPIQGNSGDAQRLAQELERMKEELETLKSERFSKDGEIQVLRQNLGKYKAEVSRLKIERVENEEKLRREQTENDKKLTKEAESLKTQLQFKERELAEAQNSFRSLEQRLQTNNNITSKHPVTPPRNSPHLKRSLMMEREQASCTTPQQEGGFPTRESFMQTNPALGSPAKVKMRLVEEGCTSKGNLRSPKRVASRSPGHISSSQLIGRLIGQPHPQDYNASLLTQGSLISTLHAAESKSCPILRNSEDSSSIPAAKLLQTGEGNGTSSKPNKNHESAIRALSSILNLSSSSTNNCANKPTSSKMEDSEQEQIEIFNVNHSNAILGVLPLLEDQLTEYIDLMHLMSVCSSSLTSTCPSSSGEGAGRCLNSSFDTVAKDEQLQFEMKESQAVNALHTLHCLVSYSQIAASHVIHGSGESGDLSIMEIDPSAPLIDPTQAPGRSISQQQMSCPANIPSASYNLPRCQILMRLIKIISIQPSEGQGPLVLDTAIRILSELTRRLPTEDAFRLSELLQSDFLHPLLTCDYPNTLCAVLTILSSLASKSWNLAQKLCTHSDTCFLLQVYQCASCGLNKCNTVDRIQIVGKIIDLLTCITSVHEDGAAFLLDTDCQCSEEVVSSMVIMLSREFRYIDPDCDLQSHRMLIIRKGLLPLHSLYMDSNFTDHRLEAEQQYNHLITEMNRLLSTLAAIHRHEVGFLQDFEGSDEDDLDQDSQEQQMDVN
ncbi:ATR-interacting protein-like isoform X2 [Lytechinus variegatus]|uniref:ATR-interacting protein-like isoform X2 n=1 Tax=Lytechinus variegatus TaxID=7654 RepID=UPI001BB2151C|nr:ATR-interacting protein-like isoform X2 [Lytechinus variegatus]